MKRWRNILMCSLLAAVCSFLACVDIEIIDLNNRSHTSLIHFKFNWNGQEADKPERMHVIAVRNVKTLRSHGFVDTNDGTNPWFGYSEPIIEVETPVVPETPEEEQPEMPETPETPENPETPEGETPEGETPEAGTDQPENGNTGSLFGMNLFTTDDQPEEETPETPEEDNPETPEGETPEEEQPEVLPEEEERYPFRLRGGDYNLLLVNYGMNTDNMELKCIRSDKTSTSTGGTATDNNNQTGNEKEEDTSLKAYLKDHNRKVNELFLCIKPLKERPAIVKDKDLPDFNPKFEYITDVPRIFYGLNAGVRVTAGNDTHVDVDMIPISQEIQVNFTIEFNGNVRIEGTPIVELSGICGHFNLMEAYVDTTQLYRSAVVSELVSQTDNQYLFRARFHTLGIVPSYDDTFLNGPGIFQVAVRAVSTSPDSKNKEGRYVYAGINPHEELTASQIIVEGDDGKLRLRFSREPVIVNVEKHLVIEENFLVNPGKGLGWEQHDPDDDANVEI